MHLFYSRDRDSDRFRLDENESRHLYRVLRLKQGDKVNVINGSGNLYTCIILDPGPGPALLEIKSVEKDYNKRNYRLHIAIAPTKNNERIEWFVEKSIEFGIDEISPIICSRSERKTYKTERARRIAISAMKQSVKTSETIINEPQSFEKFIKAEFRGSRFIAHCNKFKNNDSFYDTYTRGSNALILIGPEGDFSPGEVKQALNAGFMELSLGSSRLRTETAGVAACSLVYFSNLL